MHFGIDDEDRFLEARDVLLDALDAWAHAVDHPAQGPGLADNASILIDWRFGYSTGQLDRLTVNDVDEYLLEWCPQKLAFPPELWLGIVAGARVWVEFLAATGRWQGGRVGPVLDRLDRIEPDFVDAMGDPGNAGLAKGLFLGPALLGPDVDLDDPDSLQSAVDAFNALPEETRRALTDQYMPTGVEPDPVELTIGPSPPDEEVAASAERAPILAHVEAARAYLGSGRALTAKGNLKLADARHLVELWATDDVPDPVIGDRQFSLRSADDLPHLSYLLDAMLHAGALARRRGKLVPVAKWAERDAETNVSALFDALIELGPIRSRGGGPDDFDAFIEDGLAHWLVPLLYGEAVEVDVLVASVHEVVDTYASPGTDDIMAQVRSRLVPTHVRWALDVVERCGLVEWTGWRAEPDALWARPIREGGRLTATAAGRALLPAFVQLAGYRVTSIGDLADLDAAGVLAATTALADIDLPEVWSQWAPGRDDGDKAQLLVDALAAADDPTVRLTGLALLGQAGEAAADPIATLFGTRLAGHAALFVLENELLTADEVALLHPEVPLGPLVDVLASELDLDPDTFADRWAESVPGGDPDAALALIDAMSRVDLPETAEVLDAVGRTHDDARVAKAARKAALQARSRNL